MTGDLSRKKLLPAIYDLANRGLLPPSFGLTGLHVVIGPRIISGFREGERAGAPPRHLRRRPGQLADGIRFVQGTFDDPKAFERLSNTVAELDRDRGHEATMRSTCRCRARVPAGFDSWPIAVRRNRRKVLASCDHREPFGHDLASAKELDRVVSRCSTHRVCPYRSLSR
ncbi:MAG: hypothetical protein ACLS6O_01575 [Bifidobacterium sp.]